MRNNNQIKTIAVLLNGPPGIGKDAVTDAIIKQTSTVTKMEFKEGLRTSTASRYNVDTELAEFLFAHRRLKDIKCELFLKRSQKLSSIEGETFEYITPREALIETDAYLKKHFGRSMVGEWAAKALQDAIQFDEKTDFIFSDSGFKEEALMIAEKVDLMIVVNLQHEDYNYDNDSRNYIEVNGVNSCTIEYQARQGTVEHDAENIRALITDKIWEMRNKL
jgi:hypothetical protein